MEHPLWLENPSNQNFHITMDEAKRQSSEWIARLNADDVSNEDRARFEAWRNSHPHHARAYEELHSTWLALTSAEK